MLRVLLLSLAFLLPSVAHSATFSVDGTTSGAFGIDSQPISLTPFTAGPSLAAGGTFWITATGLVDPFSSGSDFNGPDGIFFDLTGTGLITPL